MPARKMENKDEFVRENIGLVRLLVPRFLGRGMDYDDLFQAGCIGLIKAADRFDPERGFKFSTYAVPVILGELRRMFRDDGAVKISRGLKELSMRAARETERFSAKNGAEPTISELANLLGVSEERCVEAINAGNRPLSLTDADGEWEIPVDSPEEGISDRIALRQIMTALPPEDRRLIESRYFGNMTQTQTARCLGISQVQVSRREKRILLAMREKLI